MARFYGQIGYGYSVETPKGSGTWEDKIKEYPYMGEITRKSSRLQETDKVNGDILLDQVISILADEYAIGHYANIKYVMIDGAAWTVQSVQVQRPRLILTIGGVYNGPTK